MTKTELILRIIELIFSLMGLVFIVLGWFILYQQSLKTENLRKENDIKTEKIRWKKEFIDRQIADLYGPISSLIREANIEFALIQFQLGRSYIIPKNHTFKDLPENEKKIWIHYVDTYKIPMQLKIAEILREGTHLMYNGEIPACVNTFLDYTLGWALLDNQKRNGVENYYEYYYSYNYPKSFDDYIRNTLHLLYEERTKLIE